MDRHAALPQRRSGKHAAPAVYNIGCGNTAILSPLRGQAPQFAMVALCRRRGGFLALPCSLGFRLAASPTGRARLRPFAKGAFWVMRFRMSSEYEIRWSSPLPNAPLFERGWHALHAGGLPYSSGVGAVPYQATFSQNIMYPSSAIGHLDIITQEEPESENRS